MFKQSAKCVLELVCVLESQRRTCKRGNTAGGTGVSLKHLQRALGGLYARRSVSYAQPHQEPPLHPLHSNRQASSDRHGS